MVNVFDSSIRTKHIAPVLGNIKYFNVDVHNGAMMYLRHLYVYLFLGMFFFLQWVESSINACHLCFQ